MRTRSRPATGTSTWASARISTTASPTPTRPSRASASPTTSSPPAPCCAVSYARTLETPFNENLVLSSSGCSDAVLTPLLCCTPGVSGTLAARLPQRVPRRLPAGLRQDMLSSAASTSGSTPTTPSTSASSAIRPSPSPSTGTTPRFPAMRCTWKSRTSTTSAPTSSCPRWPRASSRRSRPAPAPPPGQGGYPFRIDHDEKFNQTTHLQYTVRTMAVG